MVCFKRVYRVVIGAVCPLFMLFAYLSCPFAAEAAGADVWIAKAKTMNLASSRYWQVLGHYKPHHSSWKSLVSDPRFFLTTDGRENPESELNAAVLGLFEPAQPGHMACRFPARAEWLTKTLQIPATDLPVVSCDANKVVMDRIAPYEAVLVFPSAAIQGLGAMFGHTLVRMDAKDRSPLLSYAVNYSALIEGSGALQYIRKGLAGGFNGYFELKPYYNKLNEYKEMEERDIWEYRLKLNPEEVHMMALHALELRDIPSDYYFLDENCSLNILFLIEAARPSLHLVEHYWDNATFWVIPSDTVGYLWSIGVLQKPEYRPSLARQINFLSKEADPSVITEAARLVDHQKPDGNLGLKDPTSSEEANSRELAAKIIQYRFSKLQMTQEDYQLQYASLVRGKQVPVSFIPAPVPPHEGHSAGRIEAEIGYVKDQPFVDLGWRPAYHDITDLGTGYPDGGTLSFIDLKGRYYLATEHLQLQNAELLGFGSLSPTNTFSKPVSWSFHTGVSQMYLHDGKEHLTGYLNTGAGQSYSNTTIGLAYWLIKGKVIAGGGVKGNVDFGPGVELGVVRRFGDETQLSFRAESVYLSVSEHDFSSWFSADFIQKLSQNNSIAISETIHAIGWNRYVPETFLKWQRYF